MEWNSRTSGALKLSQLLELYYSELGVFDANSRACMRKDKFSEIAPAATLQQEVIIFIFLLFYIRELKKIIKHLLVLFI